MKNENLKRRLDKFSNGLKPGRVYRAHELSKYTNSLGRDLRLLVESQRLKTAGKGLYYVPDKLGNSEIPARTKELVEKFLKTNHFLLRSLSDFNRLDLGLTQMFKETFVYNTKRDGKVELDGREFFFKKKEFPKDHLDEYLFVDFLNNIEKLGENREMLLVTFERKWRAKAWPVDYDVVYKFAKKFGKSWVKKYFKYLKGQYEISSRK